MAVMEQLVTDHLDLWTSALKRKSTAGRGSSSKVELYGIKKLRELILELAVRGLLVPQDPNDEPASELLKKIAAEKARLVKEGKIKQGKTFPGNSGNSQSKLPTGWSWTCIAALGEIAPRNEAKNDLVTSFVPMPLISTSYDGRHGQELKSWGEIKKGYTHFADGDIAVAKITPCFENSKAAIFTGLQSGIGAGTTELHVVRPFGDHVSRNYLLLYLKSPQFLIVGESKMTGSAGQKRVPTEFFSFNPFPLPPLAEQHRIVARVDELMALCDQLESETDTHLSTHQTLVETLLAALTQAVDHAQFSSAWERLAEHFDSLFTTEESIDQLKQTILQLAVMGKLVPQDPNDEPASELLKKIAAEKARLVKEGKIKKEKPLPLVSDKEKSFAIPKGWQWCKFGVLAEFINGDRSKNYPNQNEYVQTGIPWINTGHIEPNGTLSTTEMNFITREKFESLRSGKIQPGDLVYCLRGATFGKTAFVTPYSEGAIASSLMIVRPYLREIAKYIYRYLISSLGRDQIYRFDNGSAQPNLSANSVTLFVIPLPPLQEQQRIVSKIDELYVLCDQLKSRLSEAQTTQLHLADAMAEKALARA